MSDDSASDAEFELAMVTASFSLAAIKGWPRMNIADAAREAGLSLPRARRFLPDRCALLLKFGRLADQAALSEAPAEGSVRDRLFDLIMRRIDFLQLHRPGVLALLHALPTDPATSLLLSCDDRRSMRWLLQAAGVSTRGVSGHLRVSGLMAVWLWTIRAWQKDENRDLSATMAALDAGLSRAESLASWLNRPGRGSGGAKTEASAVAYDAAPDLPLPPEAAV